MCSARAQHLFPAGHTKNDDESSSEEVLSRKQNENRVSNFVVPSIILN